VAPRPQGPGTETATSQAGTADSPAEAKPRGTQEQIDGLRAWLAQVDRKLGLRSYIGAALAALALAAAVVALVLTLSVQRDSVSQGELNALRDQLSVVELSATRAAEDDLQALRQQLADLEAEVDKLSTQQNTSDRELQVIQDDIQELRSQASSGSQSGADLGGLGAGAGGTGP
jgi:septal ring factor EnvC (AmiA/AmiB activator)